MIRPVNGHLLIEPIERSMFAETEKKQYSEIGIVIDNGEVIPEGTTSSPMTTIEATVFPKNGDKVYFDSWLAARFPKDNPKDDRDFFWLVKWDHVRAVEYAE